MDLKESDRGMIEIRRGSDKSLAFPIFLFTPEQIDFFFGMR
jgi:hypothetical protein